MSMRYPAGFISAFYNPLKNPDAPTIGTASPVSATSLSITFTAPSNVGGSAITSYIATAKRTSDGVLFSASGASSPITVTGLTAVPFTVTVVAVNSYGPSASSAASNSVTPAIPIGSAFGGGFFAGQISTAGNGIADYNLVIGPVASAENLSIRWKDENTATTGADSVIDGPQNTADMVADGNSTVYPAAHFCNDLVIGGFSDWYMPSKNELEVCYFNLKPTTTNNNTSVGINANAVPARASNYTAGTPAQTSATAFQDTGAEDFTVAEPNYYWSSTEAAANTASVKFFGSGSQPNANKTPLYFVRAVRRVAV
jgi:hypothetical protein